MEGRLRCLGVCSATYAMHRGAPLGTSLEHTKLAWEHTQSIWEHTQLN